MSREVIPRYASICASARIAAVVVWLARRVEKIALVKTTIMAVKAIAITVIAIRSSNIMKPRSSPAGATRAYRLARAGASVLLVDKARFPRDKPCGGGLTLRAVRQCPVDPAPVVEEEVDQLELRFRYGPAVVRRAGRPLILMTQRRRLDAFLLDAARSAGAEVREGTAVRIGAGCDVVLGAGERVRAEA